MGTYKSFSVSPETLSGIDVFNSLGCAQRQLLAKRCRSHCYAAGQRIISNGERNENVYFLIAGEVQIVICSSAGHQLNLQTLQPGEMFGEIAAIDESKHFADITASREAFIVILSAQDFRNTLLQFPDVTEKTMRRLAEIARRLSKRVLNITSLPCSNRLHTELLRLSKRSDCDANKAFISPIPKHHDIASYTGMRRETVSREMSRLRRAGLVERIGHVLVLNDVASLSEMVG